MSATRFDPFPGCRAQLIAQIQELERQANEWQTVITGTGSSAQWHREQLSRKFEEATKLKDTLSETCRRVADNPTRFDLPADELAARRQFLAQIETRLRNVETILAQPVVDTKPVVEDVGRRAAIDDNQHRIDGELAQREALLRENESIIDGAVDASASVKAQAVRIGNEITDSTARITQTGEKMGTTNEDLTTLNLRIREYVAKGSTWLWIGCAVLTIIVVVLILWLILGK
jgi:chromosome segregation ATPase